MLIWTESCQRLRSSTALARRGYAGNGLDWQATGGRNNGPMCKGGVSTYVWDPVPADNTFIMGYRFIPAVNITVMFQCLWNGAEQCSVRIYTSGAITVERNGTQLATTPPGMVTHGVLYYMAVKLVVHATTGSSIVYLDGVEIPALTLTNQNTRGQSVTTWNGFGVGGWGGAFGPLSWSDLYLLDGTQPHASDPNTILPDARVDYCAPNGNGYISGHTGSDGNSTDNYLLVDETTPNDDTDYVEKTGAGIDAYTVADLPQPGSTIVGVTSYLETRKTDAGLGVVRTGLRSGGTNYPSPNNKGLGLTFRDFYNCYGHDPNNGAWTEAAFNSLEVLAETV